MTRAEKAESILKELRFALDRIHEAIQERDKWERNRAIRFDEYNKLLWELAAMAKEGPTLPEGSGE